ncbi:Rieske 2Fe-2S domain-containing protein [Allitabrizicola rongguiensis]|uniref:Rieske 2Fe-2S domain-containing protein n=1 Tax=Alitabrizicola rongguiensis TaxID=2909234 RepID=UPI001F17C8AA|nr:Rieske 2Fe-2S domain-containing protein [Tabrizicola rongguiensis]
MAIARARRSPSGGLVAGGIIECPLHFGTFDYRTGESRKLPACIDLRTYPVRLENGEVQILVEA